MSHSRKFPALPQAVVRIGALLAITCGALALATTTDGWTRRFSHPLVDAAITREGAMLWRVMLGVLAAAILSGSVGMVLLAPRDDLTPRRMRGAISRSTMYAVGGITLLALLLRATRINESLWYDEVASWRTYNGGTSSWGAVVGAFLDPINHTLHTLLNRWSVDWLVGRTSLEFAFRLPALLFSIMTVALMYGLSSRVGGRRAGLIAATLAAIAPVCVLEGVEARGYAQMIFFSTAATWTLIEAFNRRSPALWLLYALCCALGTWSHFVTAWVAIGHGAWLCVRMLRRRDDRSACAQGLIALTLSAAMSITLHAPLIPGLLAWRSNFVAQRPDQPRILGDEGLHGLLQMGGSWYWWAAIPGLILCVAGLIGAATRRPSSNARSISASDALTLALAGLPLMVLAVMLSGSWLYARFMLFAIPGALLATALGIDKLWTTRRSFAIASLAVFIACSVIDLKIRPTKQPLREAVEYVQRRMQKGDRLVAVGLAHDVLSVYGLEMGIVDSFMFGRDLEQKLDSTQARWVIVEYPARVPRDRYEQLFLRGYEVVQELAGWADWSQGDIVIFQRRQIVEN